MTVESTKELILRYWRAWQERDWDTLAETLASDVDVEPFGDVSFGSASEFVAFCKKGAPWEDVTLLDSVFVDGKGALLYEGTDTDTGKRARVGEFVDVADGKVKKTRAAICL